AAAFVTRGHAGPQRRVVPGVHPQGVDVAGFKKPPPDELARDFLWRVHARVPARGKIVVFNRSHYEDVLIVRVHGLIDAAEVERRYEHIRDFEQLLSQQGTRIVKFYLHIDRDEQKERLEKRLADPNKLWKFNPADLAEREKWVDYMNAYADAIRATHTDEAPWYVIPANRKWYRDWAVLSVLVETLEQMDPQYPAADFDPTQIRVV
ncbi:MAG: polyphosphate kinase 2 family protein, partial [Burkholderiales bacterium]